MGKPSAPSTMSVHLPEPTGRDVHDSPFWKVGPVLITVDRIQHGEAAGRHGVFVDSFDPLIDVTGVIAAMMAAHKAAQAANAHDARRRSGRSQAEEIARNEATADLHEALASAVASGDVESAELFTDALRWQIEHPLTEATT